MISLFKKMSLVPKGLRYKIMIAFSLMSLIPLLVCVWLATSYIFPNIDLFLGLSLGNISLILVISIIISLLGFYTAKEMIDPIIKIAGDAKEIANGDVDKVIDVKREDEIGDLSASLNIMTQKIRENIEELKAYGEKTKLINVEINKKVLALSGLLQIGNLISSSSDLQTVLDFIARKLSDLEDESVSFVMLADEASGDFRITSSYNIDETKTQGLKIKKSEMVTHTIVVDRDLPSKSTIASRILASLDLKNISMVPITISKKQYGVLAIGNKKSNFVFKDDEKELLKVFVKQAAIAVENDLLIKKTRELAVRDELTGLYNESFIHARLDEEIKRACLYQRPCGYLLVDIDGFKDFHERFGERRAEMLLKALGEMLKVGVREVDMVGRMAADTFGIILVERNKKQAASIAEELRGKMETGLMKVMALQEKITVSIGVSENPIDGSTADELMDKAEKLAKNAKSLGKNRVAV